MRSQDIRERFLDFFRCRGHAVVPSSSLIPDDPSVLLTTAGMQQFKKYYTGGSDSLKDFGSKNTASCQKSFRTSDIDTVGDESHLTFFEMLGNFSFGGYGKREAIQYAHEFIVKEMGLPISQVKIFKGSAAVPRDEESARIWRALGIADTDIREEGMDDVFWGPTGNAGPCGPTTEIYIKNTAGQDIEIWNIVFNQFFYPGSREELLSGVPGKALAPLKQFGVDTGMGLERLAMIAQGVKTIFETDFFIPLIKLFPPNTEEVYKRIISDHIRAIVFLLADDLRPGNKEAPYILRRLMRRIILYETRLKFEEFFLQKLINVVIRVYADFYPELENNKTNILNIFIDEQKKFKTLLTGGLKRIHELITEKEKHSKVAREMRRDFGSKHEDFINFISGEEAFKIYETYGIPPELISDELAQRGYGYHKGEFQEAFERERKKHQEISRAGAAKKFGGHGLLLDTGELKAGNEEELKKVTRLHTATHLLQQALRDVLGNEVQQRGSDITVERTRFDFSFPRKVTADELQKVAAIVNQKIKEDLLVSFKESPIEEAKKTGALYYFKEKYPDRVKIYYVGDSLASAYSKEFCGGPHVSHTAEIGIFKIVKEEAVSAGTRRLRATVE